jgi:hypothetical protein
MGSRVLMVCREKMERGREEEEEEEEEEEGLFVGFCHCDLLAVPRR